MSDHDRNILKWRIAALVFVKLATSVIILAYFPSWHALGIVVFLSVPWFIVGGYYGVRWARMQHTLWKVRRLRARLLYEEWHVKEDAPPVETRQRH